MTRSTPQRITVQRSIILEELQNVRTHPTAAVLYERVRKRLPHVSLGTVYRNLDVLARMGAVTKIPGPDAECRFDGDSTDHYHIRCIECGRVDDVLERPGGLARPLPAQLSGYQITGRILEFRGICPKCQQHSPTPRSVRWPA